MPNGAPAIHPLSEDRLDLVRSFFRMINTDSYLLDFAPHPFTDKEALRVCGHKGRDLYIGVFADGAMTKMVGYGMLRGLDQGYSVPSLGLCVLEAYQGQGIGRALLGYLLKACADRGTSRAMLKVKRDNVGARALYESMGFVFQDHDQDFLIGYRTLAADDDN